MAFKSSKHLDLVIRKAVVSCVVLSHEGATV